MQKAFFFFSISCEQACTGHEITNAFGPRRGATLAFNNDTTVSVAPFALFIAALVPNTVVGSTAAAFLHHAAEQADQALLYHGVINVCSWNSTN